MKNVPNTPTPTSIMLGPTERAVLAIPVATSFNPVIIDSSRVNPAEVIFVFVVFVFKSSCKRYKKRGKFSFPPIFLLIQIFYFSILCEVFYFFLFSSVVSVELILVKLVWNDERKFCWRDRNSERWINKCDWLFLMRMLSGLLLWSELSFVFLFSHFIGFCILEIGWLSIR